MLRGIAARLMALVAGVGSYVHGGEHSVDTNLDMDEVALLAAKNDPLARIDEVVPRNFPRWV